MEVVKVAGVEGVGVVEVAGAGFVGVTGVVGFVEVAGDAGVVVGLFCPGDRYDHQENFFFPIPAVMSVDWLVSSEML